MDLLSCQSDGQQFDVDLSKITGWDALSFETTTGSALDGVLLSLLRKQAAGGIVLAADRAIVAWLWARQIVNPDIGLRDVARQVQALPGAEGDPEPPPADVAAPSPDPAPAGPQPAAAEVG